MTTYHKAGQTLSRAPSTFFRADQYSHLITGSTCRNMLRVISEIVGKSFLIPSQNSFNNKKLVIKNTYYYLCVSVCVHATYVQVLDEVRRY